MKRPMLDWVKRQVTQPLSRPVPADDEAYLRRKGPLKLGIRSLRRAWQFRLSGQSSVWRNRIDPGWSRALWIHEEAPQVGDALMDLAPRSLLTEHGIVVDLFAADHLAHLFQGDRWLRRSLSDPADLDPEAYDFAIVSSKARRALVTKRRHLPDLPWVSMAEDYSVPDYHRALFDTQRLADLLQITLSPTEMALHARQKLAYSTESAFAHLPGSLNESQVAIAVGGVRAERTYEAWPEVARALHASGVGSLVLVGSANGRESAERITAAWPDRDHLVNRVGQTDLPGAQAVFGASDLVIAADGGLMHLAFTTATPVLAIFNSAVDPAWRLPLDAAGNTLRSPSADVNDIASSLVSEAALRLLPRV